MSNDSSMCCASTADARVARAAEWFHPDSASLAKTASLERGRVFSSASRSAHLAGTASFCECRLTCAAVHLRDFEAKEMADEIPPLTISVETREGLTLDDGVFRIDRGRTAPKTRDEDELRKPAVEHIPWGYGYDNVTAMVVDPNRLFLYWEVTDASIEQARPKLGAGGQEAWLNLRIYDITGRIFDGTNSHGYFDIKVERSDRQWFVNIGKPASTHCVEIGLKSYEGYFVKIARSGRAEFPRFEPSADGSVEWLTVRTATGPVGAPQGGGPGAGGADGDSGHGGTAQANGMHAGDVFELRQLVPLQAKEIEIHTFATHEFSHSWEHVVGGVIHLAHVSWAALREVFHNQLLDGQRLLEWVTPLLVRGTWEGGPFETLSVELPTVATERYEGPVSVYALDDGRTRVVYGPWQVVVKGIDAKAEARILSRWHLQTSWVVEAGYQRVVRELAHFSGQDEVAADGLTPFMLGSSAALGASERLWLSASELRMAGGSDIYRLGASELLRRGASELVLGSASEIRMGGASEVRWGFSSEQRLGGASELGFASESRLGSELRLGASEGWAERSSSFSVLIPDAAVHGEG